MYKIYLFNAVFYLRYSRFYIKCYFFTRFSSYKKIHFLFNVDGNTGYLKKSANLAITILHVKKSFMN